jgi:hypothetical protein
VHQAMADAGYQDGQYRIVAQTYTSPIPSRGFGFRYPEFPHIRQLVGGGGILDKDASWVDAVVVETFNRSIRNAVRLSGVDNIDILDARNAFNGRRPCENTVGLLEERGVPAWNAVPWAVHQTEWLKQINQYDSKNDSFQENAHPNYWGQMALRNCFRQAYNHGAPRGGTCVRGNGLNSRGEPNMTLQ